MKSAMGLAGSWQRPVDFNVSIEIESTITQQLIITGILAAIQRTRVRKLYHLDGSIGDDCLKALCCCCCVVMQDEREVRDREELIRRNAGPSINAYSMNPTMSYAPPP